jgi:hypothetical protein
MSRNSLQRQQDMRANVLRESAVVLRGYRTRHPWVTNDIDPRFIARISSDPPLDARLLALVSSLGTMPMVRARE